MPKQKFHTIKLEKIDPAITLLTLNRPEKYNALSYQLVDEMIAALESLMFDRSCRLLIVTGAGKAFCSGTDLTLSQEEVAPDTERAYYNQKKISDLALYLRRIPQPVIAAVNGVAAGGGMCLALASDIRIAAKSARFNAAFVNVGLSAGEIGASYFLPRLIGMSRASEILYSGRFVGAEEAERIGLVAAVAEDDRIMDKTLEYAAGLLDKSPLGLQFTKEILNVTFEYGLEAALHLENRSQTL